MLNEFGEVWAVWECNCLICNHTFVLISLLEHPPGECTKCGSDWLKIGGDGDGS